MSTHLKVLATAFASMGVEEQISTQVTMNVDQVEQFVGGLIFGLIQKDDLSEIQTCLKDGQNLEVELEQIIKDFTSGDLAKITEGVEKLIDVISNQLPGDLKDCQSIQGDLVRIESWAQQFTNPIKLAEIVAANFVKHFGEIAKDVIKITKDVSSSQYYQLGDDVADLLTATLGKVPAKKALKLNPEQAEQFVAGMLMGFVQKDDLAEIQVCMKDSQSLADQITEALSYFEKKDVEDILKGIEIMGQVIEQFPTDLKDCQAIQGDLKRIETWAQIFKDPKKLAMTFASNFVMHFREVTNDIAVNVEDLKEGKFYDAGDELADILTLTLGKVPAREHNLEMSLKDTEEFVAGMIYGLIQKDDLAEIETCMADGTNLGNDITEAVNDFEKGDFESILAGVEVVGKIIQELPTDLKDCQNIQGDVDRIEKWAAIFKDPKKLATTIATNFVLHFKAITSDISKTGTDFSGKNYYNAGDDIADILIQSIGKVPAQPEDLAITQW